MASAQRRLTAADVRAHVLSDRIDLPNDLKLPTEDSLDRALAMIGRTDPVFSVETVSPGSRISTIPPLNKVSVASDAFGRSIGSTASAWPDEEKKPPLRPPGYQGEHVDKCLQSRDPDVNKCALQVLEVMGAEAAPHAGSVAVCLFNTPDVSVRLLSLQVLRAVGELAAPHASAVATFIKDADPEVRKLVRQTLHALGRPMPHAPGSVSPSMSSPPTSARGSPALGLSPSDSWARTAGTLTTLGGTRPTWTSTGSLRVGDILASPRGSQSPSGSSIVVSKDGDNTNLSLVHRARRISQQVGPPPRPLRVGGPPPVSGAASSCGSSAVPSQFGSIRSSPGGRNSPRSPQGRTGPCASLPVLARTRDPSSQVKAAAVVVLESVSRAATAMSRRGCDLASAHALGAAACLQDCDSNVRWVALEALEAIGEHAAPHAATVAACLKDGDNYVRWRALRALEAMGKLASAYGGAVADCLEDWDANVQGRALRVLAKMGDASARHANQVAGCMQQDDMFIKRRTFHTLLAIGGDTPHRGALVASLTDGDAALRRLALQYLHSIEGAAIPYLDAVAGRLTDPHVDVQEHAISIIEDLGPRAAEYAGLIAVHLGNDVAQGDGLGPRCDPAVRRRATAAMAAMGQGAVESLADLLSDEDPVNRSRALWALEATYSALDPAQAAGAADRVARQVFHKDAVRRHHALQALRVMGSAAAPHASAIAEALTDPDAQLRLEALQTLQALPSSASAPHAAEVARLLADGGADVRDAAQQLLVLACVEAPEATALAAGDRLGGLLRCPDADTMLRALAVVESLGCAAAYHAHGACEGVVPLLRHSESVVRRQALQTLAAIGAESEIAEVVARLSDPDVRVRRLALEIIDFQGHAAAPYTVSVSHRLMDNDKGIRNKAMDVLARLGPAGAAHAAAVAAHLGDDAFEVEMRRRAQAALVESGAGR